MEHDPFTRGIASPATTALPEIGRLQLGQEGLQGAGGIHLLAHDGGDLLQYAPEQRQIGVDSRPEATDVAGPDQQLMGGDFGLRRVIPQRHQHQAGDAHERSNGRPRDATIHSFAAASEPPWVEVLGATRAPKNLC